MIHNGKGGEVSVECDKCSKEHHGGTLEFREIIKEIKSLGWMVKSMGQGSNLIWQHTCPECLYEKVSKL